MGRGNWPVPHGLEREARGSERDAEEVEVRREVAGTEDREREKEGE